MGLTQPIPKNWASIMVCCMDVVPPRGWLKGWICAVQINMQEKPDGVHPKMEKYLLRKAFDRPDSPYLPESVLWRQKEQFSDGVGYDWVDRLKDYSHEVIGCAVLKLPLH